MGDEYFLYDHVPVIFWWLRWGNHVLYVSNVTMCSQINN